MPAEIEEQDKAPVVMLLVPLDIVSDDVIAAQARAPVVRPLVPFFMSPVEVSETQDRALWLMH